MKRTWRAVVSTLLVVFIIASGINWLLPLFSSPRTYSETNCLTEQITSGMDSYDIAKLYRDGNATMAVKVYGVHTQTGKAYSSLGSGVCIASKGYTTSIKNGESNLVASKGSYIVTNHHVIDMVDNSSYSNTSISIVTEGEETYPCSLLWANKNLDLAILYCDEYNMNYITMKDIIIDCEEDEKFDYQEIFAIGCPLDEQDYLNRLTIGNIATNDVLEMYTTETYGMYNVVSNVYEDVVDIAVGITSGNSGGGCFDENGYLIGLTTLGTSESLTGGNQMNGMVAIYPIMTILDKLIENNEAGGNNTIYTLENIGLYGIDSIEAGIVSYQTIKNGTDWYYLNGQQYSSLSYSVAFQFADSGYYILKNSGASVFKTLTSGTIVSCVDAEGKKWTINDRNDFIYFLLNLEKGDKITVNVKNGIGYVSQNAIQL